MAGRRPDRPGVVQVAQVGVVEDAKTQRALDVLTSAVQDLQSRGFAQVYAGEGSPEGVVEAPPGSLYTSKLGGANITFWVKESGTGSTGWVSK